MKFELDGLDELSKTLDEMEKNIDKTMDEFNGNVPLEKLFTTGFMSIHSAFSDFDEWLEAGGFKFESQEEYDNLDESVMNTYVQSSTDFQSWEEMLEAASVDAIESSLGF